MLRAALCRVSTLVRRARPRGPGVRQLWGCGARREAAGRRRAWDCGWRHSSSEPRPRAAHYQLVYTCKEHRRNPGGQRGEGVPSGRRRGPGAGFGGYGGPQVYRCSGRG
ncbi:DNL-type zinc finger [Phyllostomus discolor]|nr:DNL-type zinc finger [Phyllostomus discolor]